MHSLYRVMCKQVWYLCCCVWSNLIWIFLRGIICTWIIALYKMLPRIKLTISMQVIRGTRPPLHFFLSENVQKFWKKMSLKDRHNTITLHFGVYKFFLEIFHLTICRHLPPPKMDQIIRSFAKLQIFINVNHLVNTDFIKQMLEFPLWAANLNLIFIIFLPHTF